METQKRVHAIIVGRVQGVFFRAETQRAARQRGITGWVRNKIDGTVEAVFEGKPEALADMIQWCWQGPPLAAVEDVQLSEAECSGAYKNFQIRY